jgi:hypothetical protein
MKYEMRYQVILLIIHASFFFFACSLLSVVHAQSHAKKKLATKPAEINASPKYYHLAGLGSSPGDTTTKFPHPTVVLNVPDTTNVHIVVRFPELGLLGITEDTVRAPSFKTHDTLLGYKSRDPLYLLNFPQTRYFLFIDVWSKNGKKLLDTRPFEYNMNVQMYRTMRINLKHDPTTGMGSPTLRRKFQPTLLDFSIGTNPGWSATETLDSSLTYALVFHDPTVLGKLALSLTIRSANIGNVDSATWSNFKQKAEIAFGEHGVATSGIGSFEVADTATRRVIKAGYEFISKNVDSSLDYVAAYLTPRAIMLLLAPMDAPNQQLQVQYFEAIARSLKLD